MGGNVFQNKTRRYSAQEYADLVITVEPLLRSISFNSSTFNVCPHIIGKESFGDMDVVFVPTDMFEVNVDSLKEMFCTEDCIRNGSTWSLVYKEFQIDLIGSPLKEFDFCKNYMGMGDRGNFVGKIAHQLGLKFGHNGLWLPVRLADDHLLGSILLTLDPVVAEEFLDVGPLNSTNSIEEVFENVAASKYFNPECYKLENNSHASRVRDRKRPNYAKMVAWADALPARDWFPRNKDKTVHTDLIFSWFPDAKYEYDALIESKKKLDMYKTKFNGEIVREITGLDGKDLGNFMVKFKESGLSVDEIIELDLVSIEHFIVDFYYALEFGAKNE